MARRTAYMRLADEEEPTDNVEMNMLYTDMNEHELQELGSQEQLAPTHDRWRHQRNLDRFFRRVYSYYRGKGFVCIVSSGFLDHLTVLFVAFIVLFVAYCINFPLLHARLRNMPCGNSTVVPHDPDLSLFDPDCHGEAPMAFGRISQLPPFAVTVLSLFCLGWLYAFVRFILSIPEVAEMKVFFTQVLHITNEDLQTISWSVVLQRLMAAQLEHQLCITVKELDQLDITNFITRRTNYMIALVNKNVLNFEFSFPILGSWYVLPMSLQASLDWCFSRAIFDGYSNIRERILVGTLEDTYIMASALRFYFKIMGVLNLILAPAIFVYRCAVFVFQYSDEVRSFSGRIAARHFSPYARWKLRDFCEVEHYFEKRLAKGYKPAKEYIDMFSSEGVAVMAKFLSVLLGGFFATLLILGVILDESFFLANLTPDRSVTWWLGMSGVFLAVCRGLIPDENLVFDPARQMHRVALHTHYFPEAWRGREASPFVYREFNRLFQFRLITFLEEMVGILAAPFVLYFVLPRQADAIVTFFRSHTVRRKGVGDVCSFALFGSGQPGPDALGPEDGDEGGVVSPGAVVDMPFPPPDAKMEHSLLNFKLNNQEWTPDVASSTFLEQLGASLPPDSDAPAALGEGFAGPAAAAAHAAMEASAVGLGGARRARFVVDGEAAADAAAAELHNSLLQPSKPRLTSSLEPRPARIATTAL